MDETPKETKYHLTDAGLPAKCTATKRQCPRGGEHFTNYNDAMQHGDTPNMKTTWSTKPFVATNPPPRMQNTTFASRNSKGGGIPFGAKITAVGAVGLTLIGAAYMDTNNHQNDLQKNYESISQKAEATPYSLHMQTTGGKYTEYNGVTLTNKDLTKTNFSKCSHDIGAKTIKCSTPDGKVSVSIKTSGKYRTPEKVQVNMKEGGKNTSINYDSFSRSKTTHSGIGYISLPKTVVN